MVKPPSLAFLHNVFGGSKKEQAPVDQPAAETAVSPCLCRHPRSRTFRLALAPRLGPTAGEAAAGCALVAVAAPA